MKIAPEVRPYLATLRRIPPNVRLAMATRTFDMWNDNECVCGWAIREELLAATGSDYAPHNTEIACAETFGGTQREWEAIYYRAPKSIDGPFVEEAFAIAFMEAAEGRKLA